MEPTKVDYPTKMGYPTDLDYPTNMGYTNQPPIVVVHVTLPQVPPQSYPPSQQPQYPSQGPSLAPVQKGNNNWRNSPQTTAIAAGTFVMLSAGMNLAYGVGWMGYNSIFDVQHFCFSWFIGVIFGTVLSLPLNRVISSRIITALSSVLIIIGGIIFTADPEDDNTLLAARYINGIAVGLSIVPYLVHASEVADDSYRGTCLATEQFCVSCGIAIQMIYSSYWSYNTGFAANLMHGIMDITFGLAGLCCFKSYIESPVYYIRKGDDAAALNSLVRLQRPHMYTQHTQALLEQRKTYVREESSLTPAKTIGRGIMPLIKMILYRSTMLAFCCSLPMQSAFLYSMYTDPVSWAPAMAACVRVVGSLLSVILVDRMRRKLPSLVSMFIIGCLILWLGGIYLVGEHIDDAKHLYIALQFLLGFYSSYTSVYLGEAFPMKLKPFFMSICVIVEQLLHIIFITTITPFIGDNLTAQGGIILGSFVILWLTMPETRNISLLKAQRKFRKIFNTKCTFKEILIYNYILNALNKQ